MPAIPSVPSAASAPALPALEGVLEALDKIRSESAGNLEIEKLIESIKAKLDEKS
ncbi:MAG: hypothetical protein NTY15_05495 [Planctomycetota bacterium]|nr:hypothetical protein [Planctomycetota bacterium]